MKLTHRILGLSVAAALAAFGASALAASGTVSQLSGTLSVKKADGSVRILSQKSQVENGDTLNTERDSYAQIKFEDGAQVTLKPNTAVKIDNVTFDEQKPQTDSFFYSLVKGGLRAVTGIVGKRSKDKYQLGTATATIGIRGTTLSADDCVTTRAPDCPADPAIYVGVADGEIVVRNAQGEIGLAAGQFSMISPNQRPLFLSTDPGLQFTPPATFIQNVLGASLSGGRLECAIRTK